ncbi:hypothetical protein SAMN06296952_2709 [Oscillospiraceae bacterium]|nr:hypothetical protein SAMN06296952_2709 [Oscillospiraceae bacterium]
MTKKAATGIMATGAILAAIAGAVLMMNDNMVSGLGLIVTTSLALSIYNIYKNTKAAKENN